MTVEFKTDGFKELEEQLDRLSKSAGKGVLRRALREASQPMVEIAKSRVPKDKGSLRDSITVSVKLAKRQAGIHRKMFRNDKASVEMFLGPSYDLGAGGRHGHLVEFGTAPHINKGQFPGTQHPGTAPQPFMRAAWDEDQVKLLDRIGQNMWKELQKSIARAERKAARDAAKG